MCVCVFFYAFCNMYISLSAILVSPGKDFFHILWWIHLICMWKDLFSYKNKSEMHIESSLRVFSFFLGCRAGKNKKETWGNKRLPTLEMLSIVLFLLSAWDLCLSLIGGEQGVSAALSGELQSHGLMLCHWQQQHRRPERRRFSSRQACHCVCHFGSSFGDSWTSACDERTSESVRL